MEYYFNVVTNCFMEINKRLRIQDKCVYMLTSVPYTMNVLSFLY